MKRRKRDDTKVAMIFIAPSFLSLLLFWLFPFLDTIKRSFQNAMGNKSIGLENYKKILDSSAFQLASENTFRFISIGVPLLLFTSLILSILIKGVKHQGTFYKTVFLLPIAVPVASIALLWQVVFAQNGLANTVLLWFGGESINFMGTTTAFWVLIGTYLWKNSGYNMILWLAGMDSISHSLYEAARVDGASRLQEFRYITLPSLAPTGVLIAILSIINSFKVYREAYLVAGKYPHDSIYLLQHLFNNWFVDLDVGRMTAGAVLLAMVLGLFIFAIQRIWKEDN